MSGTLDPTSPLSSITGGLAGNIQPASSGNSNGSLTYYDGLPLIMRSSHYPSVFTKTGLTINAMPKQKFMFYACFNPSSALQSQGNIDFASWQSGFSFQIHKVDRPKVTPEIKQLHQYNRKRLVHTGVKYDPLTITMYDTADDRVLRFWQTYYQWYFGDGRLKPNVAWNRPTVEGQFTLLNGWGFSPSNATPYYTDFFDSLDIYTIYGKLYTQIRVWNPKINSIDFDGMDRQSSDFSNITMSIEHEGVNYVNSAQPLTQSLITQFGLDQGGYFEPTLNESASVYVASPNTGLLSAIDGLLSNVVSAGIGAIGSVIGGAGNNILSSTGFAPEVQVPTNGLGTSSLGIFGSYG